MRRPRRPAFVLLGALLLLSLAGGARAGEPQGDPASVDVRLDEYTIEMPKTLAPGPVVFLVHNQGQKNHSFKLTGPGIDTMLEASVRPRQTGRLEVMLQAGTYQVVCPIGNHAAKGMTMTLEVR